MKKPRFIPLTLDAGPLQDLDSALRLEWIETNGIGGFASSTVVGAQTRRYHGLLNAALFPPVARHNMLTSFDAHVTHEGWEHPLTCHLYPDTVFPHGHLTLEQFDLTPFPKWTHRIGESLTLTHELWMDPGQNTTVMTWSLPKGAPSVTLSITPLVGLRDFHTLTLHAATPPAIIDTGEGRLTIRPEAPMVSDLHLYHTSSHFELHDRWYKEFQLPIETGREEDDEEDLWNPCTLTFELSPEQPAVLIATTEESTIADPVAFAKDSQRRRAEDQTWSLLACDREPVIERLAPAVRDYRVSRADGRPTIMAGYHWFADWGRDTMIALPGLFLVHGHVDQAMATLRNWMSFIDQGMLPNRFPDMGEPPDYNTADAALWLAVAVLRTWQCMGGCGPKGLCASSDSWALPSPPPLASLSKSEVGFLREALGSIGEIIDWYQRGTRHNIHVDDDGLVTQGERGQQLTWMDAKVEDIVFTPRQGKPIEIQALWFNTLNIAALLHRQFAELDGDETARAEALEKSAQRVRSAVQSKFLSPERGGLADVIRPDGSPDLAIRPNQIFAVSLPFPLVSEEVCADILVTVEKHLLTPYGLRSLAPSDPQYIGSYWGPRPVRDAAYHQGTVWSWLIGPFIDAALRVRGVTPHNAKSLRGELDTLVQHIEGDAGLRQISEIFEGNPPHRPDGCIAQAWSVAEMLRVLWVLSGIR